MLTAWFSAQRWRWLHRRQNAATAVVIFSAKRTIELVRNSTEKSRNAVVGGGSNGRRRFSAHSSEDLLLLIKHIEGII